MEKCLQNIERFDTCFGEFILATSQCYICCIRRFGLRTSNQPHICFNCSFVRCGWVYPPGEILASPCVTCLSRHFPICNSEPPAIVNYEGIHEYCRDGESKGHRVDADFWGDLAFDSFYDQWEEWSNYGLCYECQQKGDGLISFEDVSREEKAEAANHTVLFLRRLAKPNEGTISFGKDDQSATLSSL